MRCFGITGWKNSGKTDLMTRLIAGFRADGLSVSSIKHAHHAFDIDQKGRDSYRHREAGAGQVLIASDQRWALMSEQPAPSLDQLIAKLDPVDLILVEGFKSAPIPKLECYRSVVTERPRILSHDEICFVASDTPIAGLDGRQIALDDTPAIMARIRDEVGL